MDAAWASGEWGRWPLTLLLGIGLEAAMVEAADRGMKNALGPLGPSTEPSFLFPFSLRMLYHRSNTWHQAVPRLPSSADTPSLLSAYIMAGVKALNRPYFDDLVGNFDGMETSISPVGRTTP